MPAYSKGTTVFAVRLGQTVACLAMLYIIKRFSLNLPYPKLFETVQEHFSEFDSFDNLELVYFHIYLDKKNAVYTVWLNITCIKSIYFMVAIKLFNLHDLSFS
jgi:hypothetical protein